MTEDFRLRLQAKLAEYRTWSTGRDLSHCRLIHYSGVDLIGSKGLPRHEVEPEIEALLGEGYYVDWAEHQGRLYLRVWESGGPEPDWQKVFDERPLANVDEILRGIEEQG